MKAIIQTGYGKPNKVIEPRELDRPALQDLEVKIKIQAASITFGDLAAVKGKPFIARLSLGLR
ncbi:MAG: zinc-binding alcohol dehydrogenase family protein [Spirochaetaceae bacterium]|nr:MAG: zinc-binding alcohol dehydrogenase family protein [Spirochaetaceae bacterium]